MHGVWIINGIPGVGKSTTAKELAQRFQHAAQIEGDQIQDLIVTGNVHPGETPVAEEQRQIHLNVRHQCMLARSFVENGFTAVIDYVVVDRQRLKEYLDQLPGLQVQLVTLDPGVDVALERDDTRDKAGAARPWTHLIGPIREQLGSVGLWLDNSGMSVGAAVDQILARAAEAVVQDSGGQAPPP